MRRVFFKTNFYLPTLTFTNYACSLTPEAKNMPQLRILK
jgi:hypothetical protein